MKKESDFDFLVVGSGFGGSVSACRLVEKGYKVAVLEQGRRIRSGEFARSNWDVRRYLWAPALKCFGIQNLTLFRNVLVLSGTGVGGGSLVYANTLMTPSDAFFKSPDWASLADWKAELAPHYATAKRMLGATPNPHLGFVDDVLRRVAEDMGVGETFAPTDVAIHFGAAGRKSPDPYFSGSGPEREGCTLCGACMVGCNVGAKNTLDKNYLYFAEKGGARVFAETVVTRIEPVCPSDGVAGDGSLGWKVTTECSTSWFKKKRSTVTARRVILAGGVLGTVDLLLKSKHLQKTLPFLSDALGRNVRTNSEVFTGVTELGAKRDYSRGVAIGSIMHPDSSTSVEPVRYPAGSSFMRLLSGPLVQDPRAFVRFLKFLAYGIQHPFNFLRLLFNTRWAQTSVIFLVMQNLDNRVNIRLKRSPLTLFRKAMDTEPAAGSSPVPSEVPQGNEVAFRFAEKVDGIAQCAITQVTINVPTTAHILGGCPIGPSRDTAVIDTNHEVFGYRGLFVCDGSAIPANLGVNPSLTICALTERAMSRVPAKVAGESA